MTDAKQVKNNNEKMGISPAAAVAGVVIGAGLGIAGAVAFNNKNNRAKIDKAVNGVKKQGSDFIDDVKNVVSAKKNETDDMIEEGRDKAKRISKVIKE